MSDVTRILGKIEAGDPSAAEQLLPLVYEELRKLAAAKMAQEKPGQTLQATSLVHDAYLRLVDTEQVHQWDSRGHFFSAAAEAMRRILVENARRKGRLKRGGAWRRRNLDSIQLAEDTSADDLLSLDDALAEFAGQHPEKAELVKLRFYGGLTVSDAARAMGISTTTADRYWSYARAWLFRQLRSREADAAE
jgi:RNA polymerase sigma factor (TIGR02999 family)